MRIVLFIIVVLLAGCATSTDTPAKNDVASESAYVPPAERKLYDPQVENGVIVMSREHWFHNFKASAIPGLCNDSRAGFVRAYQDAPEDCEKTIEPILDFCLEKLSERYIPEQVRGSASANAYGSAIGSCLLINYQASVGT